MHRCFPWTSFLVPPLPGLPGEGAFALDKFMGHLVRSGYAGIVSLEIFNDVFRQSNVERTAVDGLRSLIWLQDSTCALLGDDAQNHPLGIRALPGAQQPSGFDYAEIRTEDPEAVAGMLAQLGFSFRGQHRRKPVTLWSAGDARIIINSQRSRGITAEVSGFGIRPGAALGQARHHTEGPAVRATTPPMSSRCTGSLPPTPPRSSSARRLPNRRGPPSSGLAVRAPTRGWSRASTTSTWPSLGRPSTNPSSSTLHAEPGGPSGHRGSKPMGLVRSQVLRTDDGAVRLALNIVPHGLEDIGDRALRYPEHIAVHTDDIIALARRAAEAGMEFLAVPNNYYEDLAARFDLDAPTLAQLQELNLLYDRDEHGEFLHFYTETVGTMFLEVVQRRGGYDGYGAPNAPVRLAAQFERNRAMQY